MNRRLAVFGVALALLSAVVLSGGCGGSSSNSSGAGSGISSDYDPPDLTESQLVELAQNQVDASEFDISELNGAEAVNTADYASESALARKIWTEAVKLYADSSASRVTQHDSNTISQRRYVYVYRWVTPTYEINDERLTIPAKQHKYSDSGCQHGMYGTDCVGLVWNSASNAGVALWSATSKSRLGPSGLTASSNWKNWFPNAHDVSSEIGSSKPKPGDIVSWSGHVGIAAKVSDNNEERIVIIHCTGRTNSDYTCSEYKVAGETSSTLNEAYPVNGITAHEYNVNSGITVFGREAKRLRLYDDSDSGQQETPTNPEQPQNNTPNNNNDTPSEGSITVDSLNGTWTGTGSGTGSYGGITAPVNTELRYTIRNVNLSAGTAEIDIYDRTTNSQYGVDIQRGVRDGNKTGGGWRDFSVSSAGTNSWAFHANYSDGEDNITITLNTPTSGTLRLSGVMWNEDNPSERTTFDITCSITKQ